MRRRFVAVLACVLAVTAGCVSVRPTPIPMPTVAFDEGPTRQRCLVVFLPGIGDVPRDFDRHGFVKAARDARLACDMVAIDSHIGYFRNRSLVDRIEQDVVLPARARAYDQVWFVGISLGGLATILFTDRHPDQLAGILLLAPYLGDERFVHDVHEQGGARSWNPRRAAPFGAGFEPAVWDWIQRVAQPGTAHPAIYLGFGTSDRYSEGHRMLADVLPPENVLTVPGTHEWTTWRELWIAFLATQALPKRP